MVFLHHRRLFHLLPFIFGLTNGYHVNRIERRADQMQPAEDGTKGGTNKKRVKIGFQQMVQPNIRSTRKKRK